MGTGQAMRTNERCGMCQWYKQFDDTNGWCCRYAPIAVIDADGPRTLFPTVNATTDWCGEYESKS
jgi:hypothetical protein